MRASRAGKERSLLRRHPWVFEGSVASGKADAGETVRVEDSDGRFLAWAAYSPLSSIRLRAWSFDESERIDAAFFARRIARGGRRARAPADRERRRAPRPRRGRRPARAGRRPLRRHCCRRSSSRPASSAGRRRSPMRCSQTTGARRLYERSDTSAREREGLAPATGWLRRRRERRARDRGRRSASTAGASPLDVAERPQDRLLSRPARQPQALRRRGAPLRLRARPQLLLLHRRLQRRRARRRRGARDGDRFLGAGARRAPTATSRRNGFDAARHEAVDADVNQTPARVARRAPRASTRSSSTRPSSRRPSPTPSAPRAPTRTSTASR